jgi:hypothetical protein
MNPRRCSQLAVNRPNPARSELGFLLFLGGLLMGLVSGCDRVQSAEQLQERQLREHPQFRLPAAVAKFAGRVTVDGQPPKRNCRLFVILNDPKHLDQTADGGRPELFVACEPNGDFSFSHDGVVAGKYIVTFVELHRIAYRGSLFGIRTSPFLPGPEAHRQPDELHNLYNDPDRNAKVEEYVLDLQPPGSSHYQFDLVVAGKKPVEKPGPNAVVGLAKKG